MSPRKVTPKVQDEYLTIAVEEYSASIGASINSEVRRTRPESDQVPIFRFVSSIEIKGTCTAPDDRAKQTYQVTIYPPPAYEHKLDAKLEDVHVRDEHGSPRYQKVRGQLLPVYDLPFGLGLLHRKRGAIMWDGWIWTPEPMITQMLVLLGNVRPLYLHLHERKIDRTCCIDGLTLRTTDPRED
jgi:hypothetical protein